LTSALQAPWRLGVFFARLCGSWATESLGAVWIGTVLLLLLIAAVTALCRARLLAAHGVWLAMALFCLGTLFIVALGRTAMDRALASRSAYASYSQALAACTLALLVAASARASARARLLVSCCVLATVAGIANAMRLAVAAGVVDHGAKTAVAATLMDFRNRSDTELAVAYPDARKVRAGAEFLSARRWSLFAEQPANPLAVPCRRYHIGDQLRLGRHGNARPYLVDGWSIDEDGFTWTSGPRATVTLEIESVPDSLELEVGYAMVACTAGKLERQRVIAHAGDALIGSFAANAAGCSTLAVPAGTITPGSVTLVFSLPDAARDGRQLAIAVAWLCLRQRP
jgi:hypothetical protein